VLVLCFSHSPSGRYRLVALIPSWDLLLSAKYLFVWARPLLIYKCASDQTDKTMSSSDQHVAELSKRQLRHAAIAFSYRL